MSKKKEILAIYPYIDFNGTSLWGFIVGKSASLIIHKTLGIPPTILKQYHPGTFLPVPMQNPCRLSLLCCVLEPDKLHTNFVIFSCTIVWTLFKPRCISKYRKIE